MSLRPLRLSFYRTAEPEGAQLRRFSQGRISGSTFSMVHDSWRALLARTAEGGCPHAVCEL